jgi:hypothetical protein
MDIQKLLQGLEWEADKFGEPDPSVDQNLSILIKANEYILATQLLCRTLSAESAISWFHDLIENSKLFPDTILEEKCWETAEAARKNPTQDTRNGALEAAKEAGYQGVYALYAAACGQDPQVERQQIQEAESYLNASEEFQKLSAQLEFIVQDVVSGGILIFAADPDPKMYPGRVQEILKEGPLSS